MYELVRNHRVIPVQIILDFHAVFDTEEQGWVVESYNVRTCSVIRGKVNDDWAGQFEGLRKNKAPHAQW